MPEDCSGSKSGINFYHIAVGMVERINESTPLLRSEDDADQANGDASVKEAQLPGFGSIGERLPYNDYTTIDWLHDLVKDSHRLRSLSARSGLAARFSRAWNACQGWFAAATIGTFTAIVAFLVDIAVAIISDWKFGYCKTNVFTNRESCCSSVSIGPNDVTEGCSAWHDWSNAFVPAFGIYTGLALVFGVFSASITMFTKATVGGVIRQNDMDGSTMKLHTEGEGKVMYLAAGSGIPEIKTILSGFVIPGILSLKVLTIKAVGAVFAVSSGMCLGKEGPFVHISTCVAYQVAKLFPKYRNNGRKLREILSAGCAAGLAVAFGAPIGGVLFSYEEISTYFPRKVLWRAFLCSLFAAIGLKALNPTGTGKLVLFETDYGTTYQPIHYLVFILLGITGGIFGGVFCKANFLWSRTFRGIPVIKKYPVFEVFIVVLATSVIQYPNPLSREPGDIVIKNLLVDCKDPGDMDIICQMESQTDKSGYIGWLIYGTLAKLVLTTITFGCKVPSGVIIPALDGGAFFGRLVGQSISTISPGIFAMVGAAAFLAGVSRMTLSLVVVMFELTGELEYVVPHMIAIMVAKWVADAIEKEGVYDLAQTVLGHPFLDIDHASSIAQKSGDIVAALIPPKQTMDEITVLLPNDHRIARTVLQEKLDLLKRRGITDAGLLLTKDGMLFGYLPEGELAHGLEQALPVQDQVCFSNKPEDNDIDLSSFVNQTPLTISPAAPIEYAVEMFSKLGLSHLIIVDNASGKPLGVVIKKRLMSWLTGQKH